MLDSQQAGGCLVAQPSGLGGGIQSVATGIFARPAFQKVGGEIERAAVVGRFRCRSHRCVVFGAKLLRFARDAGLALADFRLEHTECVEVKGVRVTGRPGLRHLVAAVAAELVLERVDVALGGVQIATGQRGARLINDLLEPGTLLDNRPFLGVETTRECVQVLPVGHDADICSLCILQRRFCVRECFSRKWTVAVNGAPGIAKYALLLAPQLLAGARHVPAHQREPFATIDLCGFKPGPSRFEVAFADRLLRVRQRSFGPGLGGVEPGVEGVPGRADRLAGLGRISRQAVQFLVGVERELSEVSQFLPQRLVLHQILAAVFAGGHEQVRPLAEAGRELLRAVDRKVGLECRSDCALLRRRATYALDQTAQDTDFRVLGQLGADLRGEPRGSDGFHNCEHCLRNESQILSDPVAVAQK